MKWVVKIWISLGCLSTEERSTKTCRKFGWITFGKTIFGQTIFGKTFFGQTIFGHLSGNFGRMTLEKLRTTTKSDPFPIYFACIIRFVMKIFRVIEAFLKQVLHLLPFKIIPSVNGETFNNFSFLISSVGCSGLLF